MIPVNSPCSYPQCNGCIEAAQREIKHRLSSHRDPPSAFLAIQAGLDVHAINHRRRPCLGHRTSCQVFESGLGLARTFTHRKRREVYDWIVEKMLELMKEGRLAVETWLLEHGFITVHNNRKVLPNCFGKQVHN